MSVPQMSAAIAARYEIDQDKARADIQALAERLDAEDLIMMSDEPDADLSQPGPGGQRRSYEPPRLEIYRDMGDLLALDPPMPGLRDIPLQVTTEPTRSDS